MTKYKWIILAFIAIWVVGIIVVYPMIKKNQRLQVFQPADVNPQLVDAPTARRRTVSVNELTGG